MRKLTAFAMILVLFAVLYFCISPDDNSEIPPSGLSGQQLAQKHCGGCHEYVSPTWLTKSIWQEAVLPAMGHRLGIYSGGTRPDSLFEKGRSGEILKEANIFPADPILASEDWNKIVDYYINQAPDTLAQSEESVKITKRLNHFTYRKAAHSLRPPLTTMVKILPHHLGIVYADTKPNINKLIFLNSNLEKDSEINLKTAVVHYHQESDTLYLTTIGKNPFPNDKKDGDLQMVYRSDPAQPFNKSKIILGDLQRPAFVEYGDIDQDGLEDVVVSEFGNHTGQLSWFHNIGEGLYSKNILRKSPGAIHTTIADLNKDGRTDIVALMSQGREGLFYYENNVTGTASYDHGSSFKEKQLLSFSPLNGSQYFELCDFNRDGHLDILYVCGDNADKTPILKGYHGLYVFMNDGQQNFTQAYFYHQNGAYKAMAEDFDLDGDLDIASISFFPDYVDRPEESFLYLENTGNLKFTPFSFPESSQGRWMVMDAADMDDDGDLDIALGSFVYFTPMGDTTGLGDRWMKEGPSVILLENTIR